MSEDDTTLEVKGLEQILKALKKRPPVIRVGILGSNPRKSGALNNATIGAAHEFGTTKLPQRSFLRVPISDHLQNEMESSGALDEVTLKEVIKSGSVISWAKKVAILAEKIVIGAFDSGGYGKWASWKSGYTNNTGMLLVDTTQLRNSITSEVKE